MGSPSRASPAGKKRSGLSRTSRISPSSSASAGAARTATNRSATASPCSQNYGPDTLVLVHDGVRPLVSQDIISDCIRVAREKGNATTIIPTAEALLQTDDQATSTKVIDRSITKRTQTPQGFTLGTLLDMHRKAAERGIDDPVASCTLAIDLGMRVYFSKGSEKNIKLTTLDDIDIFKALLHTRRAKWLKDRPFSAQ